MLLVGGGTGLAPLLSILRHVIENGIERDMTLYWGVRSERDLYAHAALEDLAPAAAGSRSARLRYVPVLSEPSPEWPGARGWVHEAVLAGHRRSRTHTTCMPRGPPAMIAAVRREFARAESPRTGCSSIPSTTRRIRSSANG